MLKFFEKPSLVAVDKGDLLAVNLQMAEVLVQRRADLLHLVGQRVLVVVAVAEDEVGVEAAEQFDHRRIFDVAAVQDHAHVVRTKQVQGAPDAVDLVVRVAEDGDFHASPLRGVFEPVRE